MSNWMKIINSARNYEEPKLEIIRFEADDVITTSPPGEQWPEDDWGA